MPAGKKTTTPKASKATKTSKTVAAAAPVVAAPVVVEAAAAAPVSAEAEASWSAADELEALITEVSDLKSSLASTLTKLRDFKKLNDRAIKKLVKSQSKKKVSTTPRKPSGFTKPTPITPELATFLKKPAGTEMARTDVTKEINAYIRANSLQDKDNGRQINPDKKLATLLKIKADDVLTYFNLQKFMSPHFIKATPVASA